MPLKQRKKESKKITKVDTPLQQQKHMAPVISHCLGVIWYSSPVVISICFDAAKSNI